MAITLAQQNQATSSTSFVTSQGVTFAGNTTSGNLIIATIQTNANTVNFIKSVSDGTNTYTRIGGLASGNGTIDIWYAKNITGATTPTVTATCVTNNVNMAVLEIAGLDTVQPLDYYADGYSPKSTTIGLDTPNPKSTNSLLFFTCCQGGVTDTYVVGSGFSNLQQQGSSTAAGSAATQIKINSSRGPQSSLITGASATVVGVICIVVFSDTTLPPTFGQMQTNNYQFLKASDNGNAVMSVTEKIR